MDITIKQEDLLGRSTESLLFRTHTLLQQKKEQVRASMRGTRTTDGVVERVGRNDVTFRGTDGKNVTLKLTDRRLSQLMAADTTRKKGTGSCPPNTLKTRTTDPTGHP